MPGERRTGKEEKGKGEREIGSEALAETGKNCKRPSREQGIKPETPANAAGAFALFCASAKASLPISFSPFPSSSFSFPFPFDLSLALNTYYSFPPHKHFFRNPRSASWPLKTQKYHRQVQIYIQKINVIIFFIIPGMYSLMCGWLQVHTVTCTGKVPSFLICFGVGVAVFLTEQSRFVDSNDQGGTMDTDEAPVNRPVDRGASATGGAEDDQAISMSRLECSALCSVFRFWCWDDV